MKAPEHKKSIRPAQKPPKRARVSRVFGGEWTEEHLGSFDSFVESMRMLAATEPRLRKRYGGYWVAIHSAKVVAHSRNAADLVARLGKLGLKREEVLIHKIAKQPRALVV